MHPGRCTYRQYEQQEGGGRKKGVWIRAPQSNVMAVLYWQAAYSGCWSSRYVMSTPDALYAAQRQASRHLPRLLQLLPRDVHVSTEESVRALIRSTGLHRGRGKHGAEGTIETCHNNNVSGTTNLRAVKETSIAVSPAVCRTNQSTAVAGCMRMCNRRAWPALEHLP